eukprot:288363-Prymnesium_polylepis.1
MMKRWRQRNRDLWPLEERKRLERERKQQGRGRKKTRAPAIQQMQMQMQCIWIQQRYNNSVQIQQASARVGGVHPLGSDV